MYITNEKEKEDLANDKKFYSSKDKTFCLGRTLEEAAEMVRHIMKTKLSNDEVSNNVGVVISRMQ